MQPSFSHAINDYGHTTLVEHKVDVGDNSPIRQRPYRVPFKQRFFWVEEHVADMLKKGVIEPSISPWAWPILFSALKGWRNAFLSGFLSRCDGFNRSNRV